MIAATNFDGRTLPSTNNTADNLNWVENGVADPGTMSAFTFGGAAQPLFDANPFVQNMFAPALNVGNAIADATKSWTTAVSLTALPGSTVEVGSVTLDYWAVSGGQVQNVLRRSDFTVTLVSPDLVELGSVSVADVPNGATPGEATPVTLTFPEPIPLSEPGTYTLRIRAGDFLENDETGNHTAIDNLAILGTVSGGPEIRITSFVGLGGDLWEVAVQGRPLTAYELRSTPDLDFNPGLLMENLIQGDPDDPGSIGGSNDSLLVTDSNGLGMARVTLTGDRNFVRVQSTGALLSENFDQAAALPTGWTTNGPVKGTTWEVGEPSGVPSGPSAAHSLPHCAGTNIGGYYTGETDVSLVSPVISVPPGLGAIVRFRQFIDTDLVGDVGSVRILDSDNADTPIPGLEIVNISGDGTKGWTAEILNLPVGEVSGKNIKLEFRFTSNTGDVPDTSVWSGFYIDDVSVELAVP